MLRAAGMKTLIRMVSFLCMASPACKSRTMDSLSSNILCKQSREVVPESRGQTTREFLKIKTFDKLDFLNK